MQDGISKHWTPEKEFRGQYLVDSSPTFASRHLMMTMRDLLKYDLRTRAGRRATAQAKLRLATMTDEDLKELAKIYLAVVGPDKGDTVAKVLAKMVADRYKVREAGFKRRDLSASRS